MQPAHVDACVAAILVYLVQREDRGGNRRNVCVDTFTGYADEMRNPLFGQVCRYVQI